jgi:hypothetical protein
MEFGAVAEVIVGDGGEGLAHQTSGPAGNHQLLTAVAVDEFGAGIVREPDGGGTPGLNGIEIQAALGDVIKVGVEGQAVLRLEGGGIEMIAEIGAAAFAGEKDDR